MNGIESIYTNEDLKSDQFIEANFYAGPTLVVVPGIEMTIEDYAERLEQRAAAASETVYNRIVNGVIDTTVLLSTGGYTGTNGVLSEAEYILLYMGNHLKNLTQGTNIKTSLYGVDASTLNLTDLSAPREIKPNHWAIPVYIDNKAHSLVTNFASATQDLFDGEDILIAIASGSARPSSLRASVVAQMLYPHSRVETMNVEDGSQYDRIRKAILDEGIVGGLKESYLVEAILALITKFGAGEVLNKFTQKRIKHA